MRKLRILINAYACSPNMGSEPGMAWHWVSHLAHHCELHIITEGEFREQIEAVVPTLPQGRNLHFHYNPVSEEIRRMCWNQGDWRFYKYYRQWQWKTYLMAKELCQTEHIDILHQLNMIGFREPGYLWRLSRETGIPFVWGPIGGLKQFPTAYLQGARMKMKLFMWLKNLLNVLQLRYSRRVDEALRSASLLISSIPDSHRAIKKYKGLETVIIPETGCSVKQIPSTERFGRTEFHVLWVGKFDFRKQLGIALQAIAAAQNGRMILDVYGTGTVRQTETMKAKAAELGIARQVVWQGGQPHAVVQEAMRTSQLFLFTSVSEDTSSVVLEAVSNGLPVVCFEACGMAHVVSGRMGRKLPLSTPKQSVSDFANTLNELEQDRKKLKKMSENCKQEQLKWSWERKADKMKDLYQIVIRGFTPPCKCNINRELNISLAA